MASAPEGLADRVAISNLVAAYAHAVGTGDADAVGQLFRHGQLSAEGSPVVSRGSDQVRATMRAVMAAGAGQGSPLHNVVSNLAVDIDVHNRRATCRSLFTVLQVTSAGLVAVLAGRYRDEFAVIDGEWCFTARHILIDHSSPLGEALRDTARPTGHTDRPG